jgi:hypothetical protein
MTTLEKIRRVVERVARCPVTHMQSHPVVETFDGNVIWEGVVEEFGVSMPPPKTIFAWAVNAGPEPRFITIYSTEQINTAVKAVRVWIESENRK